MRLRAWAGAVGAATLADLLPTTLAVRWLRLGLMPRLSGVGQPGHVALTFDDGPDPASTPQFLDRLAELDVRASFFVLGERLVRHPELGRRLAAEGHDVAVHGWNHRPHVLRPAVAVASDVARARRAVADVTGTAPRFWRPPHGIPTATGLATARRLGMRPVLWTADGREWRSGSSAHAVVDRLRAQLRGGGVVLLHDSDYTSAPGSWRVAVDALPGLVAWCADQGWTVGPLRDHGLTY